MPARSIPVPVRKQEFLSVLEWLSKEWTQSGPVPPDLKGIGIGPKSGHTFLNEIVKASEACHPDDPVVYQLSQTNPSVLRKTCSKVSKALSVAARNLGYELAAWQARFGHLEVGRLFHRSHARPSRPTVCNITRRK